MRCGAARKWLSDEIDGALPTGMKSRLEIHLRACPECRAYRENLVRIQAAAGLPEDPSPQFWAAFERTLEARLDIAEAVPRPGGEPNLSRRRWAWAAAAVLIMAGAALWYALLRPRTAVMEAWIPFEDVLDPLVQSLESSPELASRVDREIRASIEEMSPVPDVGVLPAADPLFWEGMSDDELRAIVAELEDEIGCGGPQ